MFVKENSDKKKKKKRMWFDRNVKKHKISQKYHISGIPHMFSGN